MADENELHEVLDDLTGWVESLLAIGWSAMTADRREVAEEIAHRLEAAGLPTCAQALHSLLRASHRDSLEHFGKLAIVLELARESRELGRIARHT